MVVGSIWCVKEYRLGRLGFKSEIENIFPKITSNSYIILLNPTSHGVSDSVAPMGGSLRGPPPKKSRKETFLTPCCYFKMLQI